MLVLKFENAAKYMPLLAPRQHQRLELFWLNFISHPIPPSRSTTFKTVGKCLVYLLLYEAYDIFSGALVAGWQ